MPGAVDVGQTTDLEFTVDSNEEDSLISIQIDYSSTKFSDPADIVCPINFQTKVVDKTSGLVKCAMGIGTPIDSGVVILKGVNSQDVGEQNFSIKTIDVNGDGTSLSALVTVKNLSATAVVAPTTTNTEQTRDYTFTVTNDGGADSDTIKEVEVNVPSDFDNVSLGTDPTNWTCSYVSPLITCTANSESAEIANGNSILINVTATAPTTVPTTAITVWTTEVTGSLGGGMNPATQPTITVQTPPSIEEISMTISPATVSQGQAGVSFSVNVKNTGEVNVELDTDSTISFTDGTNIYSATLSKATTIDSGATATLIFEGSDINASMIAANYNPILTLSGIDANTAVFLQTINTTSNQITVQTPASLSVGEITSDVPAISKQSGAVNTAIISILAINSGQATADALNKTLVIKDAGGTTDISGQFTILEKTLAISSVDGGATQILVWEVTANSDTTYEGVAQIEVSVLYNDANIGQQIPTPAIGSNTNIFEVDNTSPDGGSVDYTNGYETDTVANITVSKGTDSGSGINSVQLYKQEAVLSNNSCGAFGNWSTEGTQILGTTVIDIITESGKCYMFKYEATDLAGNVGVYTSTNVLKVDTSAPSGLQVTDDGDYTNDNTQLHVSWSATDSESGVVKYEYTIGTTVDGTNIVDWIDVEANTAVTKTGLTLMDKQIYYFSVRATNDAGLISNVKNSNGIIIDVSGPVVCDISITPSSGTTYISGTSVISATVTDAGSGVKNCDYTLDGGTSWTSANYSGEICSVVGVNTLGATSINIKATDNLGNSGEGTTILVTVDITSPVTTDGGTDTNWYNTDVTVTLSPTDIGGSGVANTLYCVDQTDTCIPDISGTSVIMSDNGTSYVKYHSVDNVGNIETVKSAVNTVKIDKTNPAITDIIITYPTGQTKVKNGDTITVTAQVSDGLSGISSVVLKASSVGGGSNISMNLNNGVYTAQVTVAGTAGDSEKIITVTATDNATNFSSQDGAVSVDNTSPSVSSYTLNGESASVAFDPNDPANVNIIINAGEDVKFTIIDILDSKNVQVKRFTQITYSDTVTKDWDGKNTNGVIVSDGEYTIKVKMIDSAGNEKREELTTYIMTVDTVPPTVNITSPQANDVVIGDLIINATVTGTSSCSYKFDSGTEISINCAGGTVSIAGLSEGHHTLNFYGKDNAGNTASDSVNFIVNNDGILTVDDTTGNNPDFATIQSAINAAISGDTISVAEGIYNENLVVDKKLTIQSSGITANTTINALTSSDYVVNIIADNVTLDGFTITGLSATNTILPNNAAIITQGVDGCTITNNILTGNHEVAISLFGGVGSEYSDSNTVSNNVINAPNDHGETYGIKIKGSHNTISGNAIYNADTSIHVWSWSDTETVSPDYNVISGNTIAQGVGGTASRKYGIEIKTGQYNKVTGNTISVTRAGIHLYTSSAMKAEANFDPRPSHSTISDNIITGGEVGIVLLEGANTNTISNNDISGTSIAGVLGSLSRWPSDWGNSPSTLLQETPQAYLQITGNIFTDNILGNCGHGIAMEYADNNIIGQSGHGNIIKNNADTTAINYHDVAFTADYAGIYFDANSAGNVVNYNSIVNNTSGLKNANATTTLNAEANWWGTNTGPVHSSNLSGTGNAVSNDVDFRPWCITSACTPTIDSTSPTVTLAYDKISPVMAGTLVVTAEYSESILNTPKININQQGTIDISNAEMIVTSNTDRKIWTYAYTVNTTIGDTYKDGEATVSLADAWDNYGNIAIAPSANTIFIIDTATPIISKIEVNSDSSTSKVGDTIALIITADQAGYTASAITVNGEDVATPLVNNGDNTYIATYLVVEGNPDVASGVITASVILKDTAGNENIAYTTVTTNTLAVDANTPVINSVISDAAGVGWLKVGDTITFTVDVDTTETGLVITPDTYNGGSLAWTTTDSGDTYTATYTVAEGQDDQVPALQLTGVQATDPAGNISIAVDGSDVAKTIDANTPTVALLFFSSTLQGGSQYLIEWNATDENNNFSNAPIKLEYSDDNEYSWNDIVANTANDEYLWLVPNVNSSACYIKITATDLAGNNVVVQNADAFEISLDNTSPTVTLKSPNSGENLEAGSDYNITWEASDNITAAGDLKVKLDYSKNGGTNWTAITESDSNPQFYQWTVPEEAIGENVAIRITVIDEVNKEGLSVRSINITAKPVELTSICIENSDKTWTCDIKLTTGWNLISSPVVISENIATALSDITGNADVIQYYNSGTWLYYDPDVTGNTLTTFEDGKGYWVYMDNPDTLTLAGLADPAVDGGSLIPITYNINGNDWNLIGFRSVNDMVAGDYINSYINSSASDYIMWKFDNGNSLEYLSKTDKMKPGYGYWFREK